MVSSWTCRWRSEPAAYLAPNGTGGTDRNSAPRINEPFRTSSTVEQAAVNRKVQGSNPWSGAKSEYEIARPADRSAMDYISFTSVLHQFVSRFGSVGP